MINFTIEEIEELQHMIRQRFDKKHTDESVIISLTEKINSETGGQLDIFVDELKSDL